MKNCQCCGSLDDGKDCNGVFICRECGRKAATKLNKVLTQEEIVSLFLSGDLRSLVIRHQNDLDEMRFDLMMRR